MTDHPPAADLLTHETRLPKSASIIEAFRSETEPADDVLRTAARLAHQHQLQWDAETISRDQSASAEAIAASKRTIDALNAGRSALIECLDTEITARLSAAPASAPLHTETLGSVMDRLGIAWVRANNLIDNGTKDRARQALDQLRELATAYDDLLREVASGTRRVPDWRLLKQYQAAS